jgi:hypothetical protein
MTTEKHDPWALLREAQRLIAANRLMLGHYYGVREVGSLEDRIDAMLDLLDSSTVPPVSPCPVCFIPHETLTVGAWCDSCRQALPDDRDFSWVAVKHVEWGARRARWGQRKLAALIKKRDAR